QLAKWCARPGKMMCAAGKWCARHFGCNGRPWENDVRVDVRLGVRVDVRASGSGACSAAHIIFIRRAIDVIRSITGPLLGGRKGRSSEATSDGQMDHGQVRK